MVKNKVFCRYYLLSLLGILLASLWPLAMGVRVVRDMIVKGTVLGADYPKYIIPYLPVSLAVMIGVVLMPILIRACRKYAFLTSSAVGMGIFFATELMLENWVIITDTVVTTLESWQMYMCYVPPGMFETRTWRAVDVLIGEYSPAFKIHFYIIAIVLILVFLNCFYGFAQVILDGARGRVRHLVMQSVAAVMFLGLCIFACFTAFFRTGELVVSPLSAVLMCIFFVILGVTVGICTGSFLFGRASGISVVLPAAVASAVTLLMYIGEMFLLSGHLYRFGTGFFFDGLGTLVLAPVDVAVILLSGGVTAGILRLAARKSG